MTVFLPACINLYHDFLADGCQIAHNLIQAIFLKWAQNVIIIAHCVPLVIVTGRYSTLWPDLGFGLFFVHITIWLWKTQSPASPTLLWPWSERQLQYSAYLCALLLLLSFCWVFIIFLPAHGVISVDVFSIFQHFQW